jgi:hypothetical protein
MEVQDRFYEKKQHLGHNLETISIICTFFLNLVLREIHNCHNVGYPADIRNVLEKRRAGEQVGIAGRELRQVSEVLGKTASMHPPMVPDACVGRRGLVNSLADCSSASARYPGTSP